MERLIRDVIAMVPSLRCWINIAPMMNTIRDRSLGVQALSIFRTITWPGLGFLDRWIHFHGGWFVDTMRHIRSIQRTLQDFRGATNGDALLAASRLGQGLDAVRHATNEAIAMSGRFLSAVNGLFVWFVNLPTRACLAVGRVSKMTGQRIFAAVKFTCKAALYGLGLYVLLTGFFILVRLLLRRYRAHMFQKRQTQQAELRVAQYTAQARRMQEQRDRARLLAEEEHRQRRLREEEADRLREEHARSEQRQKEHIRRFAEAAKHQCKMEIRLSYMQWRASCEAVFSSPATATCIPEPPNWPCNDVGCKASRHLRACKHNLKDLFFSTSEPRQTLKEDRKRWSPNRRVYGELEKAGVGEARAIANEIAAVINNLLDAPLSAA